MKINVIFRLIVNTQNGIYKTSKNMKSSSTEEILGKDSNTYRKWLEYQLTPEINWSNIESDHVKVFLSFDTSLDEGLRRVLIGKNTQPLLKEIPPPKGTKNNFLDYQLQFIQPHQFLRLNEEGLSQVFY